MSEVDTDRKRVGMGFVGSRLDAGKGPKRWERWRPTVSMCSFPDLYFDRIELWHDRRATAIGQTLRDDIELVSPGTEVDLRLVELEDPWDFEEVFAALHDVASRIDFDVDSEEYLLNITTGTHVAQICTFLLTESRHFPARLLQISPPKKSEHESPGNYRVIDLDLSRYDRLAARFAEERHQGVTLLKSGIETKNENFNRVMQNVERVALASTAPILLQGETGVGKTRLARQIYELRKRRSMVDGAFVEVNCATLRGDGAMSALFGHRRGAFTGAVDRRDGLLKSADGGVLFLDEIGELGPDEQAMLLRAVETGRFLPLGSDKEVSSEFQLISGTNNNLQEAVREGDFRDDLLARINLWTFDLPGLAERSEDIEPNLHYELARFRSSTGSTVRFNKRARELFLEFATGTRGRWPDNFRGLNASVTRMATLAAGGRIDEDLVLEELQRLENQWQLTAPPTDAHETLSHVLSPDALAELDRFDRVQLADVITVCQQSTSLSEAGRTLFAQSRLRRKSRNDADRLRKYLAKFDLDWDSLNTSSSAT